MSQNELRRNQYIERYNGWNITYNEFIQIIWVGVRQWRRIIAEYREDWPESLIHGLRWKPSNHQTPTDLHEQVKHIITEKYSEIYPTLVAEKLQEHHAIILSIETVRKIMTNMGLWKPKSRKKASPPFMLRERRDCYGSMIQFDGSYHSWISSEKWCLLLAIDDATSQITYAEFGKDEGIAWVFPFWRNYLSWVGVPESIYLDRFATYKNNNPEMPDVPTQFGRVCKSFGIELIFALSPQAKWRVERGNGTLQKRLVAEMKLEGIATIDEANIFLKEIYIPKHNAKFAVVPKSNTNMHRTMREDECRQLNTIFSVHSDRKITNDYTISFKKQIYQLHGGGAMIFRKEHVRVEERCDGEIVITQKEKTIPYTLLPERPKKGYTLPLPPRIIEQKLIKNLPEKRKNSSWMQGFTYGKNDPRNNYKKKEELVASQFTPPL